MLLSSRNQGGMVLHMKHLFFVDDDDTPVEEILVEATWQADLVEEAFEDFLD